MKATASLTLVLALLGATATAQTSPATTDRGPQESAKGKLQVPTPGAPSAESVQPAAAAPQAPICDAACIRGNADRAVQLCAPRVEAEAPGDFEWLMRPYGSIFQEADAPAQPTSPVVRYRGDSIRFLSPQKEWVRAIYECSFDTAKGQVAAVKVRLGVLGKANAVPVLPASPQAKTSQNSPKPQQAQAAPAAQPVAPAAQPAAPTSDRRRVGEPSDVSVLQVKPRTGNP